MSKSNRIHDLKILEATNIQHQGEDENTDVLSFLLQETDWNGTITHTNEDTTNPPHTSPIHKSISTLQDISSNRNFNFQSSPSSPITTTLPTTTTNISSLESMSMNSPILNSQQDTVGIGGKGGIIYDINKIKRNLVQETVRKYKDELFTLLSIPSTPPMVTTTNIIRTGTNSPTTTGISSSIQSYHTNKNGKQYSPPKTIEDLIEEKIAALISTNPVATTTDSNLLEGQWVFAFSSFHVDSILNESRFELRKERQKLDISRKEKGDVYPHHDGKEQGLQTRKGPFHSPDNKSQRPKLEKSSSRFLVPRPWKSSSSSRDNPFRTSQRIFRLEELEQDDVPHVIEETIYMGGKFTTYRRFHVVGLTRKSLQLELHNSTNYLLGKEIRNDPHQLPQELDLRILYLDSDLCISITNDELQVFTKSEKWIAKEETVKRKVRFLLATVSWFSKMESPMKLRRRFRSFWTRRLEGMNNNKTVLEKPIKSDKDPIASSILLRKSYDSGSNLTVLRIGDVGDRVFKEEEAWDGQSDPFVHLSADERQAKLKAMSIEEIEKAGKEFKKRKERMNRKNISRTRPKSFRRPEDNS